MESNTILSVLPAIVNFVGISIGIGLAFCGWRKQQQINYQYHVSKIRVDRQITLYESLIELEKKRHKLGQAANANKILLEEIKPLLINIQLYAPNDFVELGLKITEGINNGTDVTSHFSELTKKALKSLRKELEINNK